MNLLLLLCSFWIGLGESEIQKDNGFMLLLSPLSTVEEILQVENQLKDKNAQVTLSDINFRNGLLESVKIKITSDVCMVDNATYNDFASLDFKKYPVIMIFSSHNCKKGVGIAQVTLSNFSGMAEIFGFDESDSITTWSGGINALDAMSIKN